VVLGLFQKRNRRRPRLWQNLATLTGIVSLLYLLTVGPGDPLSLLNLRMHGLVALTGGQEQLQSWAVERLGESRESMGERGPDWHVPRECWSRQVRRLKPKYVCVDRFFQNDQEAVILSYGGGFLHWYVVVGPPGSIPDPKLDEGLPDSLWFRWADGVYCWFPD